MRNEELNTKFDKLVNGKRLKRAVDKYISKGDLILSIIEELKPDGEYDADLIKIFTDEELVEVDTLLEALTTLITSIDAIKEINENIS